MTKDEALKLSLVAFEEINKLSVGENAVCLPAEIDTAMDACRKVLAQPEQEPVAWPVGWVDDGGTVFWKDKPPADGADLYTAPPQRTWVGLTDEDCKGMSAGDKAVAMWADRTLKEKNT